MIEVFVRNGRLIDPGDDSEGARDRPPTDEAPTAPAAEPAERAGRRCRPSDAADGGRRRDRCPDDERGRCAAWIRADAGSSQCRLLRHGVDAGQRGAGACRRPGDRGGRRSTRRWPRPSARSARRLRTVGHWRRPSKPR